MTQPAQRARGEAAPPSPHERADRAVPKITASTGRNAHVTLASGEVLATSHSSAEIAQLTTDPRLGATKGGAGASAQSVAVVLADGSVRAIDPSTIVTVA